MSAFWIAAAVGVIPPLVSLPFSLLDLIVALFFGATVGLAVVVVREGIDVNQREK